MQGPMVRKILFVRSSGGIVGGKRTEWETKMSTLKLHSRLAVTTLVSTLVAATMSGLATQASAAASVAKLDSIKGSVMVSQGGKYVPASTATGLKAGDRVVAMNGQAQVNFADGCVVSVAPQAMVTLGEASPCAASKGLVHSSDPAQFGLSGFTGALVIFGIGLLLIALAYDEDDDPVSP